MRLAHPGWRAFARLAQPCRAAAEPACAAADRTGAAVTRVGSATGTDVPAMAASNAHFTAVRIE